MCSCRVQCAFIHGDINSHRRQKDIMPKAKLIFCNRCLQSIAVMIHIVPCFLVFLTILIFANLLYHFASMTKQQHCIFLCGIPPWGWPKKTEIYTMISTILHLIKVQLLECVATCLSLWNMNNFKYTCPYCSRTFGNVFVSVCVSSLTQTRTLWPSILGFSPWQGQVDWRK
jgi:hypothetical protein